jgi:hypothetical protein
MLTIEEDDRDDAQDVNDDDQVDFGTLDNMIATRCWYAATRFRNGSRIIFLQNVPSLTLGVCAAPLIIIKTMTTIMCGVFYDKTLMLCCWRCADLG